ncbi:potassium channel family protein [Mycobacterium sp. B14F4]|uniref:potassium channel family protein n=1 Tax=Mycobacterium sp. B14F4 TaxID=3153565 RepID=UPI00325E737B
MAAIVVLFLIAYAVDVLDQPRGAAAFAVAVIAWGSGAAFAADYLVRFTMATELLHRALGNAIRGRVVIYTVSGAVLLVFVASLAVLDTERYAPGAHITSFGQALWWSLTTITTVGYGDLTPVTGTGRMIAVLLMIGGISLVGSITATLASWIVQRVADQQSADEAVTTAHLDKVLGEVHQLRADLRRLGEDADRHP